ncbi:hypothetical protein V8E52_004710 [Russula decolorans]
MASPQHSSSLDGSTSSGYPSPYLSSDSSVSGYSWLLDRLPRLSPNIPASLLHGSASPHPSGSGLSEIQLPEWVQELAWEMPPSPPHLPEAFEPASPHSSLAGSGPEISLPEWWQELVQEVPPSPQHTGSDRATTLSPIPRRTDLRLRTIHHLCHRRIPYRGIPTSRCPHHIRRRQTGRCLRTTFRHRTGWHLRTTRCRRGRHPHLPRRQLRGLWRIRNS